LLLYNARLKTTFFTHEKYDAPKIIPNKYFEEGILRL
jgi:hypothetical protein